MLVWPGSPLSMKPEKGILAQTPCFCFHCKKKTKKQKHAATSVLQAYIAWSSKSAGFHLNVRQIFEEFLEKKKGKKCKLGSHQLAGANKLH